MPLSDELHKKIVTFSEKGNDFFDDDNFSAAQAEYEAAFKLIPLPKNNYEASSWLLAGIGDCLYYQKSYQKALETFKYGEACEGGLNAFIWLRIGECYAELEDIPNAREFLLRAYMMEGEEMFTEEDVKYQVIIQDLIDMDETKE